MPDYFDGDFAKGIVSKAVFSAAGHHPEVFVEYKVGSEAFQYKTDMWFLTSYRPGQIVTIIYDPSHPSVGSIYSFIGYWIKWSELFLTAAFFIILFLAAVSITGKNTNEIISSEQLKNKRKYDD